MVQPKGKTNLKPKQNILIVSPDEQFREQMALHVRKKNKSYNVRTGETLASMGFDADATAAIVLDLSNAADKAAAIKPIPAWEEVGIKSVVVSDNVRDLAMLRQKGSRILEVNPVTPMNERAQIVAQAVNDLFPQERRR